MAKRFIDTNIFNDEWFCGLSKDCKLFFIYFITQCDHAGVLRLNKKLCEFQTGIKSIETITKELGNCLVTVKEGVYFLPKFIKFQYPNFPNSHVKQQSGAINILESLGINEEKLKSYLTVNKDLTKSYDNETVNVNDNEVIKSQLQIFIQSLKNVSKLKTQLTFEESEKLTTKFSKKLVHKTLLSMENKADLTKKYKSVYLTLLAWCDNSGEANIITQEDRNKIKADSFIQGL